MLAGEFDHYNKGRIDLTTPATLSQTPSTTTLCLTL
jgi:hypothetical protein